MTPYVEPEQLRIVKGELTPDELAALVVVFNAALKHASDVARERSVRPEWNAPYRAMRPALHHGVNAWRRSALPH